MGVTFGKNTASLGAQRRLGEATRTLSSVFERLSSGQRIIRPSDDPAGLAVSSKLHTQSKIYGRAERNVSDGISLLNIADGAASQIGELLTRMAELAEQAANGSYSQTQRRNLNEEYQALDLEIRRITQTTSFNGIDLLTGELSTKDRTSVVSSVLSASPFHTDAEGRYVVFGETSGDLVLFDTQSGDNVHLTGGTAFDKGVVSDDGKVVYTTNAQDGLVLYDIATEQYTTIISSSIGGGEFSLSADGSTVVFETNLDITDGGGLGDVNPTIGNDSLYTFDTVSQTFTYRANLTNGLDDLAISSDGASFAFIDSASDIKVGSLLGGESTLTTVANSSGNIPNLIGISSDSTVYFTSKDDLTGDNGAGVEQIFSGSSSSTLAQLTDFSSESLNTGLLPTLFGNVPTLSADGSSLYFIADYDPNGENSDGLDQAFRLDIVLGGVTQLSLFDDGAFGITDPFVFSRDGGSLFGYDGGTIYHYDTTPDAFSFGIETGSGEVGTILSQIHGVLADVRGLGGYSISSQGSAQAALDSVQNGIDGLGILQGTLGAALSRLETAGSLAGSYKDELQTAESRILDADIAVETANLLRLQIVQQAATSVLAQANQQPEIALSLLEG